MADDILTREFETRGGTAEANQLRPDGNSSGGSTVKSSDLREKGDADDVVEAVIQGDGEGAAREIGLRTDAPMEIRRDAADDAPRAQQAEAAQPVTPLDAAEFRPVADTGESAAGEFAPAHNLSGQDAGPAAVATGEAAPAEAPPAPSGC